MGQNASSVTSLIKWLSSKKGTKIIPLGGLPRPSMLAVMMSESMGNWSRLNCSLSSACLDLNSSANCLEAASNRSNSSCCTAMQNYAWKWWRNMLCLCRVLCAGWNTLLDWKTMLGHMHEHLKNSGAVMHNKWDIVACKMLLLHSYMQDVASPCIHARCCFTVHICNILPLIQN